jgi:hypothetical protein
VISHFTFSNVKISSSGEGSTGTQDEMLYVSCHVLLCPKYSAWHLSSVPLSLFFLRDISLWTTQSVNTNVQDYFYHCFLLCRLGLHVLLIHRIGSDFLTSYMVVLMRWELLHSWTIGIWAGFPVTWIYQSLAGVQLISSTLLWGHSHPRHIILLWRSRVTSSGACVHLLVNVDILSISLSKLSLVLN